MIYLVLKVKFSVTKDLGWVWIVADRTFAFFWLDHVHCSGDQKRVVGLTLIYLVLKVKFSVTKDLGWVWIAVDRTFAFFWLDPVHCSGDPQVQNSAKSNLKLSLTELFTHLKIILLQCFQFSVFSNKLYPNRPLV